jgi:hypothetical protein
MDGLGMVGGGGGGGELAKKIVQKVFLPFHPKVLFLYQTNQTKGHLQHDIIYSMGYLYCPRKNTI